MNVGLSGTHGRLKAKQAAALFHTLAWLGGGELHHGGCVGTDSVGHRMAHQLSYRSVVHRPTTESKWATSVEVDEVQLWDSQAACSAAIVAQSDVLVVVPSQHRQAGNAAWEMVETALRCGSIRVLVIRPDGSTKEEQ